MMRSCRNKGVAVRAIVRSNQTLKILDDTHTHGAGYDFGQGGCDCLAGALATLSVGRRMMVVRKSDRVVDHIVTITSDGCVLDSVGASTKEAFLRRYSKYAFGEHFALEPYDAAQVTQGVRQSKCAAALARYLRNAKHLQHHLRTLKEE